MTSNEKMLSFLYSSYKQTISTFGQEEKTNSFFLSQIKKLLKIGQIDPIIYETIINVIGLENKPFNWEKSIKRISTFGNIMNTLCQYDDLKIKNAKLTTLYEMENIDKEIFDIIRNIYGFPDVTKGKERDLFGNFDISEETIASSLDSNFDSNKEKWDKFEKKYKNFIVQVKNPNAVCCSDLFYFTPPVDELLHHKSALHAIKQGSPFSICSRIVHNDGCHTHTTLYENEQATKEAKEINFEELYNNIYKNKETDYERD